MAFRKPEGRYPVKKFTIKVTEHREGLFVVEAEDENDALERLGRIIDTDDSIGEWSDADYRDMFDN